MVIVWLLTRAETDWFFIWTVKPLLGFNQMRINLSQMAASPLTVSNNTNAEKLAFHLSYATGESLPHHLPVRASMCDSKEDLPPSLIRWVFFAIGLELMFQPWFSSHP
jgi:hypothetical protein